MTDNLTSLFFVAGLTASFCLKQVKTRFIWWGGIILGLMGSLTLFLVKYYQPKKMNIAIIRFNRLTVVSIAVLVILASLWGIFRQLIDRTGEKEWMTLVYAVLMALTLSAGMIYLFPQVYQYTQEFVYFGEESISTMALLRATGFLLGLLLVLILALSVYRVSLALKDYPRKWFIICGLLFFGLDYGVRAVAALQRLRVIKLSDIVFQIMIVGDRYATYFTYLLLIVGLIGLVYAISKNWRVTGEFANNALRRKAKAGLRRHRRWAYSLLISSLMVVFVLSVIHYYDTKEVELTPPQDYQVEENKIIIPLTDIDDGHLHRFSYETPNGYDVRFIAVKKPQGNAYGLGLDACEICGIAGYFERGDDVVCKRCDVVMNKATIGFKGGCNPIPFPYVIQEAKVIIDMKDLEREEKRFK